MKQKKVIGLLGGVTWHSSAMYYEQLNELAASLGGFASANITMRSVNFAEVVPLQKNYNQQKLEEFTQRELELLKAGGAELTAICSNTFHTYLNDESMGESFVSIYDSLAQYIKEKKYGCVALLGTRYVMEEGSYAQALRRRGETRNESIRIDKERPDAVVPRDPVRGKPAKMGRTV